MAVAGFKPVLGDLVLGAAGFSLPGDNAGFCDAILRKAAGSRPARLESLTYVLPGRGREAWGGENRSTVVVNLLMQLRASCDQNNIFLRTGQASQAQIMAQLRQTLARSDRAVRAQAVEIERAVRSSLFQENEFRQALAKLGREVKKNCVRPWRPVPLTPVRPAAAPPGPGAVRRSGSPFVPFARELLQAQPFWNGRTAMPLPLRMTARERTQPGTDGQTLVQDRAKLWKAGETAVQTGQWLLKNEKRGRPETFGIPRWQTVVYEEVRQGAEPVYAVALAGRTSSEQGAAPPAKLRFQEAEELENTVPLREGTLDALFQEEKASKRIRQRGKPRGETKRSEEKTRKGSQQNRCSTSKKGQGKDDLPSLMPISPERSLETSAGMWGEVLQSGGGGQTGQTYAPPALYWIAAGFQAGIFPVLRAGKFPASLRFGANWRIAKEVSVLFSRNPGTGLEARFTGRNPAPSGLAQEWRQSAPAFWEENLSETGPALEQAAPHMPPLNGIISAIKAPTQMTMAPDGMARQTFNAARGQTVWNLGHAGASSGLKLEKTAGASGQVIPHLYRQICRTMPSEIRTAAVRYVSRVKRVVSFLGTPEVIHCSNQMLETPAPIFTGTAIPGSLKQLLPVSAGNMALYSLGWPILTPLADPIQSPAGLSVANPQTVFRAIFQHQRAWQMQAGILTRSAAATPSRIEPSQRLVERRTLNQWLTAPDSANTEGDGAIRIGLRRRTLPGMAGKVLRRWMDAVQAAAEAVPEELKDAIFHSRTSGPIEWFRPYFRGTTHFDGDTAPEKTFRIPDRQIGQGAGFRQGGGRVFLPMFRPAAIPAQGGVPARRQLAASAAPVQGGVPARRQLMASAAPVQGGVPARRQLMASAAPVQDGVPARRQITTSAGSAQSGALTLGQLAASNVPAQRGILSWGRFAASAAAKQKPMGNSVSGRYAPDSLRRMPARVREGGLKPQRIRLQSVAGIPSGNHLPRTRMRTPEAGSDWAKTWIGKPMPGNGWFEAGAGTLKPVSGPLEAGMKMSQTGNSLLPTRLERARAERVVARLEEHPALPGLAHLARPLGPLKDRLPGMPPNAQTLGGRKGNDLQGGSPVMIFRSPAPAAAQNDCSQEQEGEAVLAAQAVPPEQARAMNRAFSYSAPAGTESGMEVEPGVLFECIQNAERGAQEVNYNRLTEELLVRIERRLRAERRKFGL